MSLDHGGHLTHGHKVNFSGRLYNFEAYGVDPETEVLDYEAIAEKARECKPKLLLAGASAYPRIIDFAALRAIADEVGAYLMVDMGPHRGPGGRRSASEPRLPTATWLPQPPTRRYAGRAAA